MSAEGACFRRTGKPYGHCQSWYISTQGDGVCRRASGVEAFYLTSGKRGFVRECPYLSLFGRDTAVFRWEGVAKKGAARVRLFEIRFIAPTRTSRRYASSWNSNSPSQ